MIEVGLWGGNIPLYKHHSDTVIGQVLSRERPGTMTGGEPVMCSIFDVYGKRVRKGVAC